MSSLIAGYVRTKPLIGLVVVLDNVSLHEVNAVSND